MKIRAASMMDAGGIQSLIDKGRCWFGDLYLRAMALEEKLAQSDISFSAEDDGAPANYWFVAETHGRITAVIELQTLSGYELHCQSYRQEHMLHRSDALGICHSQKLYSLDAGLLGMDQLTLGLTLSDDSVDLVALMQHLLGFRQTLRQSRQPVYVALPGVNGPAFWAATGERLIGIDYRDLRYAHAELLPAAQLPECFVAAAQAHMASTSALIPALKAMGFAPTNRFDPLDGGPIWRFAAQV